MKRWALLLGLVALAGCARFAPRPLAPAQTAAQLEAHSLVAPALRSFVETHLHRNFPEWPLGLSVTLPVFNRNPRANAEAPARRVEAAARFNALPARALAEIDLAVAGYCAAAQKPAEADTMLAAQAMRDAGEISKSELTGLQLQLSASALARLDALVKAQPAAGQLEDAVESPFDVPLAPIESVRHPPQS